MERHTYVLKICQALCEFSAQVAAECQYFLIMDWVVSVKINTLNVLPVMP